MAKIILAAVALLSCVQLTAQTAPDTATVGAKRYHLWAGVHVGFGGGSINTVNAEGRKVNPGFMALPAFGASIMAPFGVDSRIGMRIDAGVSRLASKMRPYEFFDGQTNWNGSLNEEYSHFTVAPMFNLGGFLVGVGINFPMSGTISSANGSSEYLVPRSEMATAIDARMGAQIPAWRSSVGVLSVDIMATYVLGGVYNDKRYIYGSDVQANGLPAEKSLLINPIVQNMVPASLRVGASFLFDIGF